MVTNPFLPEEHVAEHRRKVAASRERYAYLVAEARAVLINADCQKSSSGCLSSVEAL